MTRTILGANRAYNLSKRLSAPLFGWPDGPGRACKPARGFAACKACAGSLLAASCSQGEDKKSACPVGAESLAEQMPLNASYPATLARLQTGLPTHASPDSAAGRVALLA